MQNTANAINQSGFRQDFQHGDLVAKYRYSMRSTGTTAANPQFLYIFRGNNSGSANRLQVNVDKTNNQIVLGQYVSGSYSTLASKSSITTSFDTDYEIQIVADGRHVEVWWGTAGSDLAKVIEVETATVLSGPRYHFLVTQDTVVRVDDIQITTPDSDTTTYTYNNGNELLTMVKGGVTTTFTYDDYGRQVSKIIGANSSVYTYRFGSMLKDVASTIPGEADLVQYVYDAFNKRREVVVTEASVITSDLWYRYDGGFNAIARYDDGAGTWGMGVRNLSVAYTGMKPLLEVIGSNPSSGSAQYYLSDHLGSTRSLYSSGKALLARLDYTPFGEAAARISGINATFGFTGKSWETGAGLYAFPYRYLDPTRGSWGARDSLGTLDGLNVYNYVGNEPVGYNDSLGLAKGSAQKCASLWRKMANIRKDLKKRRKDVLENPQNLPETCPGDCEKPSLSVEGHRRIIRELEENLKEKMQEYIDKCLDDDGTPRYPVPVPAPIPIIVYGPPDTSLEQGCPADMVESAPFFVNPIFAL